VERIFALRANFNLQISDHAETDMELAKAHRPHVILMDLRLPGMDGFTAFQKLKGGPQTQSIPAITVSPHAMTEDIHKALDRGFDSYLTQPVDIPTFLKTMDHYLKKA